VLGSEAEIWRNDDFIAFSSSPLLVNGRVYSTIATGSLLAPTPPRARRSGARNSAPTSSTPRPRSPTASFYVPMHNGNVHVLKDAGDKAQIVSTNKMEAHRLPRRTGLLR
jgi:hypothetical protein